MKLAVILALLNSLPLYREDAKGSEKTAQMTGIAHAISGEILSDEQTVFLIMWGEFETHYSLRIHSGNCRKWECDRGKAKGPWQSHRRPLPVGVEYTEIQVADAARHVRWAYRECRGSVLGAIRVLAGRGCSHPWPSEYLRERRLRELLTRAYTRA